MALADVAPIVAASAASVAAIAAATSAVMSRRAVERANLAFVWPDFHLGVDEEDGKTLVVVRLRSDGPGIALDVRWSVFFVPEPGRRAWRDAENEAGAVATRAVRALRSGESMPPPGKRVDGFRSTWPIHEEFENEPWWVVVRWSDTAGRRWEFVEANRGLELAGRPRRVRRPRW